jgi:hypothetical protein
MKPRLFIGCSSESLSIAEKIQEFLLHDIEARIWDQGTFALGETFLESLRREVLLSEYALLIVSPDDQITKRGRSGYAPRDNILFELGLFMGAIGPRRSFYLVVTDRNKGGGEIEIPSDLSGISRLQIEAGDADHELQLRIQCRKIKDAIVRVGSESDLGILPSTSLAIGYFKNFVLEVCRALYRTSELKIGSGVYDLTKDIFDFHIVLPDRGSDASQAGFLKFTRSRQLQQIQITGETGSRRFPFFVDSSVHNGRIQMYDYPTTLRAAREAILIASSRGLSDAEIAALEAREIRNFAATLVRLLKSSDAADFRDNIHITFVSAL